MIKTTLIIIICLFSYNIFSQSNENIYAKDGVLIGKRKDFIMQCAIGIEAKPNATFDEKYQVCECVLNLFSKFYTSKELIALMNNGKNPYTEIFLSENPLIKIQFKKCSSKYLEIIDTSKNLTTMAPNFSADFIIACQYTMKNEKEIDKSIDINKYCECLDNEYSKKGITVSTLKEFQDKNSISYNEILQKCANASSLIKNKEDDLIANDIESEKVVGFVPIINNGSLNKVKISFGKISKYFTIDSGASDTSISVEIERELLLEGLINKSSYLEDGYYTLANGDIEKCRRILISYVVLGNFKVKNVVLSVSNTGKDLLLGKSILNKFEQWSIDNKNSLLYLKKRNNILNNKVDFYKRGIDSYEKMDYVEAIENLSIAIDFDSKNEDAYFKRGLANTKLKYYENAILDFTNAIAIDKKVEIYYFNRGLVKMIVKDYVGSIEDYNKALEININDALVIGFRGETKLKLKDIRGAMLDYNKALKLDPKLAVIYKLRGLAKIDIKVQF